MTCIVWLNAIATVVCNFGSMLVSDLLITMSCVHRPAASVQAGLNPLPLTPGMGSVGSVTPRGLSSSSSALDALTGASGVGQGRPRSNLDSDTGSFGGSPARQLAMDRLESDQENEPPLR